MENLKPSTIWTRRPIRVIWHISTVIVAALLSASSADAGSRRARLSSELSTHLASGSGDIEVIVTGSVEKTARLSQRHGLRVKKQLESGAVFSVSRQELDALSQDLEVESLSGNPLVRSAMALTTNVTGAEAAWSGAIESLGKVNGSGIGVAIIDSGIADHPALASRVVASVDFTDRRGRGVDFYGHGTHIAGIIAGSEIAASGVTSLYKGGVAPGAHLINVRVLNNAGAGYTSDVIAGLQWTVANRAKYGIRVVNLSLGHTQVEPCLLDPLCISAEQASAAGLVVVVSAGNSGKNAAGQEVLASIMTPGVSPSAITVAALNTWGTVTPDDDTIATYSSRGPTKYEVGLKPDVAAPGNKIVSLEAPGSYLAKKYPGLHVAGSHNNGYYMMSGTSMAAGMVSGGAALLLEGTMLTARQVKIALQLSARFMADAGMLRAGLGRVNLYSARRVNSAVTTLTGTIPPVTLAGRTVQPSGMMMANGRPLVDGLTAPVGTLVVGPLGMLATWLDQVLSPARVAALRGSQLVWGDQFAQQLVWGDQLPFGQQLVWGDRTPFGQQLVWGDQSLGQQLVWGDQTLGQQLVWGDQTRGQQLVWGDQTAGQQLVWGDADSSNANQLVWGDGLPPGQ